ncbi:hypothetical protein L2E82_27603 [Cichorium intybus]|uniref:Uncharacterized protein n=1 Tax=Cichorium intybus TaxID=13427 RepID=A0ACB9CTJ4_CICIN|nr:hypothetical protein L2E82_27603 [Cichorium intybus]
MYKDDRKFYEEGGGAEMADDLMFSAEELRIDVGLGYPKAYAKLCRDRGFGPYSHGPPFTFTPYALQSHESLRANELDELFPIIDLKAKPSTKPKIFVSLLWKQLNHLGNAGFDPETFRVDSYGNVLYFHADSASPLAWDIDHWFPCSRGGLTVSSNLRLLQWQACKKKHHKLEFLVPWWDLQVGISVNQFLSIFASSNSDFRQRGFYLLFSNGESEELNSLQTVNSHSFPQPFNESKKKLGLAPAAIVISRKESNIMTPARKSRANMSKENEIPETVMNPYQALVIARDSLRQNEETLKKQSEIVKLDEEVMELKQKNEEERTSIQDLELVLIKKRRRAEKCRRLAEAQASYKSMLEKMIRDAMHQSVVYKEQVRLNQAASNSLMARLEAQKAICDSSERELHKKFKHRDELEKQIRPEWDQRKRSRMDDGNDDKMVLYLQPESKEIQEPNKDLALLQENDDNTVLYLPGVSSAHKQLRVFLEEEHKESEAEIERNEEQYDIDNGKKMERLRIEENGVSFDLPFPNDEELVKEDEDEEKRKERGKGNVEKWLQILLDEEGISGTQQNISKTDEIIRKMNLKYPQKEILKNEVTEIVEEDMIMKKNPPPYKISSRKSSVGEMESEKAVNRRKSFEVKERSEKIGKFKDIARSESARVLRRIPSSPSIILGMKKGVDCMRKKPAVMGDDEDVENRGVNGNFMKSSYKVIKKVVKM